MTITPAYGRDYKSANAALEDYNADKDFIVADITNPYNGKPVNKSQLSGVDVMIRYNKLTKITGVE